MPVGSIQHWQDLLNHFPVTGNLLYQVLKIDKLTHRLNRHNRFNKLENQYAQDLPEPDGCCCDSESVT